MNTEHITVATTAHLTERECNVELAAIAKEKPSTIWMREYGFLFPADLMVEYLKANGLSARLPNLMAVSVLARFLGADWVMLDRDGDALPSLPVFDW